MDRFQYAEARMSSDESFRIREKGVNLYDGDEKVRFRTRGIVRVIFVESSVALSFPASAFRRLHLRIITK
jgi:hypothetical protein